MPSRSSQLHAKQVAHLVVGVVVIDEELAGVTAQRRTVSSGLRSYAERRHIAPTSSRTQTQSPVRAAKPSKIGSIFKSSLPDTTQINKLNALFQTRLKLINAHPDQTSINQFVVRTENDGTKHCWVVYSIIFNNIILYS